MRGLLLTLVNVLSPVMINGPDGTGHHSDPAGSDTTHSLGRPGPSRRLGLRDNDAAGAISRMAEKPSSPRKRRLPRRQVPSGRKPGSHPARIIGQITWRTGERR
jgi:hypothetical protein